MDGQDKPLSYRDSGVDIDAGDALVERIKRTSQRTRRPEVMGGIGGFAALCSIPQNYREPVLVSGTDGVGTKLKLAMQLGRHETIGIDLVAMCANDLVVTGAEPLFFLDYYATGKLDVDTAAQVIAGIGQGCELAGCALVGGETAEMPGMYDGGDYDLAGFCVGVVERSTIIDGTQLREGDGLIALASSGPHSNGYSLIRAILNRVNDWQSQSIEGQSLANLLMAPTRVYVKPILELRKSTRVGAIAHITGGGLIDNLPRVLPDGLSACINRKSWRIPGIFQWLQQRGQVADTEMLRTFNCGIGIVICVPPDEIDKALRQLALHGERPWLLGQIIATPDQPSTVLFRDD